MFSAGPYKLNWKEVNLTARLLHHRGQRRAGLQTKQSNGDSLGQLEEVTGADQTSRRCDAMGGCAQPLF